MKMNWTAKDINRLDLIRRAYPDATDEDVGRLFSVVDDQGRFLSEDQVWRARSTHGIPARNKPTRDKTGTTSQ